MPIKRHHVTGMDLVRAREIVRSLTPLKGLSSNDAEFVARTIAECFAKGREQGLYSARAGQELEARGALPPSWSPTAQERHSS